MVHKCDECGQLTGKNHLWGCDIERCPKCDKQLLTCGCGFTHITEDEETLITEDGQEYDRIKVLNSIDEDFNGCV